MEIVFTDPPPRIGYAQHPWGDIATQLKRRPGEWALCLRGVHIQATSINRGALNAFKPAGSFEARAIADGGKDQKNRPTFDLYIRYVGEGKDTTPADKSAADD